MPGHDKLLDAVSLMPATTAAIRIKHLIALPELAIKAAILLVVAIPANDRQDNRKITVLPGQQGLTDKKALKINPPGTEPTIKPPQTRKPHHHPDRLEINPRV